MAKARGSLYRQPKSPFWWISYYVNGRQIRESTKTADQKVAQKLLATKVAANVIPDKRTISGLLDGLIADYERNGRKSIDWCKSLVRSQLRPNFGGNKVAALSKQMVLDYMDQRRKLGRKNATINHEVALLRRAFALADAKFPRIAKLSENNVRKGFLMPEQYVMLLDKLQPHIKPIFQFAYRTGCRKGEILNLKWSNVNLADGLVRLEVGETKSGDGRTIPLTSDLLRMLEGMPRVCEYVFTYRGKRVRNFTKAWKKGCKVSELPDVLFHDLRRTGVRNLVRAGVPEHIAMSISGHKTRAVFDRYNIVSETDKKDAIAKLEAAQTVLEQQVEGKLPGKIDSFMVSTEEPKK